VHRSRKLTQDLSSDSMVALYVSIKHPLTTAAAPEAEEEVEDLVAVEATTKMVAAAEDIVAEVDTVCLLILDLLILN
jgi:hypothetical protein